MSETPSPLISMQAASYRYPSAASWSIERISVSVRAGEIVLLTGPTGCGKSTTLRLAAGLLQRHGQGECAGSVQICGHDPAVMRPSQRVRLLGFVSQEPADQLIAGCVADELAFAMESAGMSPAQMQEQIPALMERVGLDVSPDRSTRALSGGQIQRLVTAAALSAGAKVLLLDEPLAQLDPDGAQDLLRYLRGLADQGVAVLMIEHRLEACLPHCDRIVLMRSGRLVLDRPVTALQPGSALLAELRRMGLSIPGLLDLKDRLGGRAPDPPVLPARASSQPADQGVPLLSVQDACHRYLGADQGREVQDTLRAISFQAHAGERIAIIGANGAGKSTLLRAIDGQISLRSGQIISTGRRVGVPQDPDLALFCETAQAELAYGPQEQRCSAAQIQTRIQRAAQALSITALLDRAPQALSRGQRLRVAVAAALSCQPTLLLLDEPTSGQDHDQIERMMHALQAHLRDGVLLFATHDIDMALRHSTRVLVMHQGRLIVDAPPLAALAALSEFPDVPVQIPPLARFCLDRGWPPMTAAVLAGGSQEARAGELR